MFDTMSTAAAVLNTQRKNTHVDVVEVISVCYELDQLQRHHKGEDHAGDGQYHVVREGADHAVNIGVPRLRGAAVCPAASATLALTLSKRPVRLSMMPPTSSSLSHSVNFSHIKSNGSASFPPPARVRRAGAKGFSVRHCTA